MRYALIITSLLGLAAVTGCAGQSPRVVGPDASDPMWTPPGEATLVVRTPAAQNVSNATAMAAPQPNKTLIRTRQIHAANY